MEEHNNLDYNQFILFVILSGILVLSLQWIESLSQQINLNNENIPNVNINIKTSPTPIPIQTDNIFVKHKTKEHE